MKRIWISLCIAQKLAALIVLCLHFSSTDPESGKIILVGAFDPMADLLEPYAGNNVERLNPYQLGQQLAGLNGMAFCFSCFGLTLSKQSSHNANMYRCTPQRSS